MTSAVSPLAPKTYPEMPKLPGVSLAVAEAGIKYQGRKDVLLMSFDELATVAGVYTKSYCPSAPVEWCKQISSNGRARAVLINSGNANAFTGIKGWEAVRLSAEIAAKALHCPVNQIYLASTGVIGEPLDAMRFETVIDDLSTGNNRATWLDAAEAIMTTDTFPKVATSTITIGGKPVTINAIAKGSGMIAPNMATMLSFITTDADIDGDALQAMLKRAVDSSFNCITVDSDTSTSDTVLLFATGRADTPKIEKLRSAPGKVFYQALEAVCKDLAQQIIKDGEGASKFVEINVVGAKSKRSAKRVALSIANSPLVKTAIAGEDANWGRIVMAVGKAGEPADRDLLTIWFGDVRVAVQGERDPTYCEEAASAVMKEDHIPITIDLGLARGQATVWTCDLTKQYVAINGDYRS